MYMVTSFWTTRV